LGDSGYKCNKEGVDNALAGTMPKAWSGRGCGKSILESRDKSVGRPRNRFRLGLERQQAGRVQGRMLGRVGEDWGGLGNKWGNNPLI
tara:strand:- start:1274 stop:1534 length:261 start_codon:yes stop_codon:yes gene_type:complete